MDADTLQFLSELEREHTVSPNDQQVPPGERPCPICGEKMQVEIEQGIHIDSCSQHGVWLDRGEFPSIILRIRSGERLDKMRLIRDAKREGKLSGAALGVWSLLFD